MLLAQSYYKTKDYENAKIRIIEGMKQHAIENSEPKSAWVKLTYLIYTGLAVEGPRERARTTLEDIYPKADIDFGENIECAVTAASNDVVKDQALCEIEGAKKDRYKIYERR